MPESGATKLEKAASSFSGSTVEFVNASDDIAANDPEHLLISDSEPYVALTWKIISEKDAPWATKRIRSGVHCPVRLILIFLLYNEDFSTMGS